MERQARSRKRPVSGIIFTFYGRLGLRPSPPHMALSAAASVDEYLLELPPERREVIRSVLTLVREHVQPGFEEHMGFGMICWSVPLARYPKTYNKQPLAFVSLAAQKRHYALYLMCAYSDGPPLAYLSEAFAAAGKKLDMGKACLRFTSLDDVPWKAVGDTIARYSVDEWIATTEAARSTRSTGK